MSVELSADQREELIGVLVGNIELDGYSPVFNEADLEFVSSLDNDQLLRLAPLATNEEDEEDEDDAEEDVTDNGGGMYGKKEEEKKKDKRSLVGFTDEELEEEMNMRKSKNYGQKMKKEKNMGKMKKTGNSSSAQEWLASAPEEIRSVVANAIQREETLRNELIEQITGNDKNTLEYSDYASLPLNVLQGIAGLCESKVVGNSEQDLYELFKRPNYAGQASPRPVANSSNVTPLVEPVIDWSSMGS